MIGFIIALLITIVVFLDVIETIEWMRRQREQDKLLLMMTLAITIVLMMSEYTLQITQKR